MKLPFRFPTLLVLPTLLATLAVANVEKVIFLGPPTVEVPSQKPTLSDLHLDTLTPETTTSSAVRTELDRVFPSESESGSGSGSESGRATWLLLRGLTEAAYATSRLESETHHPAPEGKETSYGEEMRRDPREGESVLLLRVLAAADYYADDADLMANPPPVLVDLILDPFLLNVLPRSLAPTVGYVVAVAIATWFVARGLASQLRTFAITREQRGSKKDQ
ncbi:hypothetical protein GMORB2_6332 [Geosmithia morbida]|uniref:Uncharacterized protein n=1 Tax=Geosmithia morbida TaxID=1094350 RepID=A0A9P5D4K2_9HYPO|nr:uncharacterized protein GMORB2_6332 [Geosmithia morbida]KAF4123631.1 hypothetical protein GMORB2_6332 [Geosmithia morbida]